MVVFIFSPSSVFNEVKRFFQFSNVVIISADPGHQRISRNGFGGRLHQASDNDAVVIGAGSLKDKVLEDGMVHIGQFKQFDIRGVTEQAFNDRSESQNEDRSEDTPNKAHHQIGEEGEDDSHFRVKDDPNKHGARGDGEEVEVGRRRDGKKLSSQNIGAQLKKFEERNDTEQGGGEEEKIFLGKGDLPDILSRELIEAGQDQEREKAHANEDGQKMGSLLCLLGGLVF